MINGILKKLQDTPAVTAYVPANRILPLVQMQGDVVPAILVDLEGVRTNESKSATSRNDDNDVAVVVVSESAKQAYQIASACRDALDGFAGASDGVQIAECRFVNWATDEADGGRLFILSSAYAVATMRGGATALVSGTVPIATGGSLTVQETNAADSATATTLEFPANSVTHAASKATISLLQGLAAEYAGEAGAGAIFANGLLGDINQDGSVTTSDLLQLLGNFGNTASPTSSQLTQSLARAQSQLNDGSTPFFSNSRIGAAQASVTALTNAGHTVEYFEGVNGVQGRGFISNYLADTVTDNTVRRTLYVSATPFPTALSQMQAYALGPFNDTAQATVQAVVDAYINSITSNGSILVVRTLISSSPDKLLDTYTGAAAAYSVRLLDKDYSGSCMRIRRDSDDSETDIGFDGSGDLDTSAIATHCGSANGYVVTWYDQANVGGTAVNATQSTGGSQPQIYDGSAVITDNGKPALYPNGVGYFTSNFSIADGFTATMVFNQNNEGSQYILGSANSVLKPAIYFAGTAFRVFAGSYAGVGTRLALQALYVGIYDAAGSGNIVGRVNQTESVSATASAYTPGTSMQILASNTGGVAKHTVQEVIIWPSNQRSAGNISNIETDINNYYSIY